jgi:hypothetical protein
LTHLPQLQRCTPQTLAGAIGFGQAAIELRTVDHHVQSIPERFGPPWPDRLPSERPSHRTVLRAMPGRWCP